MPTSSVGFKIYSTKTVGKAFDQQTLQGSGRVEKGFETAEAGL
jgi:hypothetical protein